MNLLLALHLLLALLAPAVAARLGPQVFLVAALAPAASFGWLMLQLPAVVAGQELTSSWAWAPTLGLGVDLRLDALALLLALLVTGVGALVLAYASRYFAGRTEGLGRNAGVLTLFAGAMLALVLADSVLLLYVAWELTTVCSFLLIADDGTTGEGRRGALRALLVTTGAGFAMLLGLLLLADAAGTYSLSGMVARPPTGTQASVAVVLVLVGALAKSGQVPFHPWLPAAMVAPTPVSAYLHAAAMVKAGVYLVARLAPAFAELPPWRPLVLGVGVATMLLGGWRAMRQTDLKRLLAFGTVAQLGFLLVLVGAGSRVAALAGATMLLAHALFKSTLFLVVGIIDHSAGTRELTALTGLWRRAPLLLAVAALACGSMVGLPPFVGYLGKEAGLEAFVEAGPGHGWVLAGITLGSVLTVAYTARFLWGAFADRDGVETDWHSPVRGFVAPAVVLSVAALVLGLVPDRVDALAAAYADTYPGAGERYHLALWHGLGPPVLLSLVTFALGVPLHLLLRPGTAPMLLPGRLGALAAQDGIATGVLAVARRLTARTQVGVLPQYLVIMLATVALLAGGSALFEVGLPAGVRPWDSPGQAVLGALVVVCCAAVVVSRGRLTSVLVLSAAGYLVAGLFVIHGAPDLALTQVLVETLTFVVFVLVLRRMPSGTPDHAVRGRLLRGVVALAFGATVALAVLVTSARHARSRVVEGYLEGAPEHGGPNVVNVVLVEYRALDTLGEVTVLAIAATAVASLVLASTRMGGAPGARPVATQRTDDTVEERR